jgi:hypothetical protein
MLSEMDQDLLANLSVLSLALDYLVVRSVLVTVTLGGYRSNEHECFLVVADF